MGRGRAGELEWELTTELRLQRLSPATEAISKRIADTQDTLKALQDKVTAILANGSSFSSLVPPTSPR